MSEDKTLETLESYYLKGQDLFEKQLSLISAGALTLSIGHFKDFSERGVSDCSKIILVLSWALLGATLLLNLLSHFISIGKISEHISYLHSGDKLPDHNKHYKPVTNLNIATLITLAIGIVLTIIFVTLNF